MLDVTPGGLSASFVARLSGGASRLASLLLPQILPVFSVVASRHPGAALRNLHYNSRGQATSRASAASRSWLHQTRIDLRAAATCALLPDGLRAPRESNSACSATRARDRTRKAQPDGSDVSDRTR